MSAIHYPPNRPTTIPTPPRWGCAASPCSWIIPTDCLRCDACASGDCDEAELMAEMTEMAIQWVYEMTAYRFPGICQVVLTPCSGECGCPAICSCTTGCRVYELDLSNHLCAPVAMNDDGTYRLKIIEAGVAWTYGTDYWLDSPWHIVSTKPFPWRQDVTAPIGAAGTWEIAAAIGVEPPKMLTRAVGKLACELAKDAVGQPTCLPDGVRSVSRRGLSMDADAERVTFDGEKTGIPLLDFALGRWGLTEADSELYWVGRTAPEPYRFFGRVAPHPAGAV